MVLDFTTVLSLSITAIISLVAIFFLVKPFLPTENLMPGSLDASTELDKKLRELDSLSSKNLMLDSLEELELSKLNGMLTEQEYMEHKELLLQDAATRIDQDSRLAQGSPLDRD